MMMARSPGTGLVLLAAAYTATTPALSLDPRRYPPSTSIELDRGVEPLIRTPLPATLFAPEDLPQAFSWRNVSSGARDASGNVLFQNMVTIPRNQHIPQYCGSCWAHAATSSLSDRLLIANKGQGQQINLAPQYLLNCGNDSSIGRDVGSCHGGSAIRSFEYIAKHGIVDETCCPYQAKNLFVRSKAETCVPDMICRNCDHTGCWAVPEGDGPAHHRRAYVTEYGPAKGEHAMMAEVFARGPIACSMNASNPDFEGLHYAGYNGQLARGGSKIFVDKHPGQNRDTTHVVSVVGWGLDDETELKYWIVRNSWGTYWGLQDWFLIQRGSNALLIEEHCYFGVPTMHKPQ